MRWRGRPSRQERLRQYFAALSPDAPLLTYQELSDWLADGSTAKQVFYSVRELRRFQGLNAPVLRALSRPAIRRAKARAQAVLSDDARVQELRRRANVAQIEALLNGDPSLRVEFAAARLRRPSL
jgi:hypothetical protein